MLFVTLPFVVRTVQPVLLELDQEMEQAAQVARRHRAADLPARRLPEHPPGHPLRRRARLREGGGRVRLPRDHHRATCPYKTQVSSVFIFSRIESGDRAGAAAVAVVLLAISFALLLAIGVDPPLRDEARPWLVPSAGSGSASSRSATSPRSCSGRSRSSSTATFENGFDAAWAALSSPGDDPRLQADADHHGDRRAGEHRLRDRLRARDRAPQVPRQGHRERVRRPAARALAGRRRAVALPALRPRRLVRRWLSRPRHPGPLRAPVDGDRDDLRLAAVRRARGRPDAARDRRRAGAGCAHAGRLVLADVSAHHAARDPLGGRSTASSSRRRAASASSAPSPSSPATLRARRRPPRCASRSATSRSTSPAPTRSRSCSPLLAVLVLVAMTVIQTQGGGRLVSIVVKVSRSASTTSPRSRTSRSRSRRAR